MKGSCRPVAALASACLTCASVFAQQGEPPKWQAATSFEHSHLSAGLGEWHTSSLQIARRWDRRQFFEGELTQARRFGLEDTEVAAGGSLALGARLTASLRASYSDTHRVLPRAGASFGLQYEFRPAWLLHGGMRLTRYSEQRVSQASLLVEHYFGDWGALAGVHVAHASGRDGTVGELRLHRYFDDGSRFGLLASTGHEVSTVAPGDVRLTSVRAVALLGQQALSRGWFLRYGVHWIRQGDFYTRRGINFGLQAAF